MTRISSNAPAHQRVVIVAAILAAVIGGFTGTPAIVTQFWIALAPVAFFGLGHGGADPLLLRRLARARRRTTLLWFAAYITLGTCFVGVIVWRPAVALILFLLLSVWHFGRSDAPFQGFRRGSPAIWLAGSIVIIGPMFGHPVQTAQLFAWLLDYAPGPVITTVEFLGPLLMAIWAIGLGVLGVMDAASPRLAGIVELLAVATAMILLPPIIAFTFYFCAVHSTRHYMELLANAQPTDRDMPALRFLFRNAAPATLAAVALGALAWWFLGTGRDLPGMGVEGVRVLFWGLATLSVPHVFVVERWWKPDATTIPDTTSQR